MPEKPTYEELEQRVRELQEAEAKQKTAEKALEESEERFQKIINALPQFIAHNNKDLEYQFVNQTYQDKFNLPASEIIGKQLFEVIGKNAFEKARPHVERVLKGEVVRYYEHFEYKHGEPNFIEGYLIPAFAKDGTVDGYYAVLTDITPYIKMQESLGCKEKTLQEAQEIARMGAFTWDLRTDSLDWSSHMFTIAGLDPQDSHGNLSTAIEAMIHPEDRQVVADQVAEMVKQKRTWPMEFRLVRPDGEVRWLCSGSRFTFDEDGAPICCVGVHHDITEQKQAEAALRASEEKYRNIFLNSPLGIFRSTLEGQFLEVNPALAEMLGYDSPESVIKNIHSISEQIYLRPDKRNQIVADQIDSKDVKQYINHYKRRDGTEFIANLYLKTLYEKGRPVCLEGIVEDITERRQAEEALHRSEEKYRLLFDNTSLMVSVFDHKGVCQMANRKAESLFGADPGELKGKTFYDLNPDSADEFMERLRYIIESGSTRYYEDEIELTTGKKWLFTEAQPIPGEHGGFENVQVISQDITERKVFEDSLRDSEAKFRLIAESIVEDIWQLDRNGKVTYVSPAVQRIFGYTPEEALDLDFQSFFPDSEIERARSAFSKALSGHPYQLIEFTGQKKNGATIPVEVSVTPIFKDKLTIGVQGIARDITERKQAEEALRESEEKYRNLFNNAPVGIFRTDADGRSLMANQAMARILGFASPREAVEYLNDLGKQLYVNPERREQFLELLKEKGSVEDFEYEARTCDGRNIWISMNAVAIPSGEDDSFMIEGFANDVTKRKLAEEHKALLEEQFQQSQKMESIGRLAGGVAHDLNNLLSPILGFSELLLEDPFLRESQRESTEEIVSAGKRAKALVRQLLAFSRRQPLQFQQININELVKGFIKLLRRTVREDIELQTNLAPLLPTIKGDLGQLEQVVMNLTVNSQDAMPHGGRLTIETAPVELDEGYAEGKKGVLPGNYVKLAISDTGSGMAPETLKNLFEPFFTTKEKGKGTGLGMSTAYGIIKQHSGNIWAYSELGLGTTIKVYLPVSEEASADEPGASVGKPIEAEGSETVLLVEDDQQVRNLSSMVLKRYGYNVLVAENGQHALSIFDAHQGSIQLLLTDVIMPDMNGKYLYEKLSSSQQGLKVLYMSGYTDNVIAHHGVIDEGVNFIEKPFTVKSLASKVRTVLDQKAEYG